MRTSLSIPREAGSPGPDSVVNAHHRRRPGRLLWLTALAFALAAVLAPAALADSKLYWANATGGQLSLTRLDGSGGGGDLAISGATVNTPLGIAIDAAAGKIYWANQGANVISVANLDGSGGSDLDTTGATVDSPRGVAIDPAGGKIYWANTGGNRISVANLDGSGSGADLDTTGATVNGPAGVAIDPAGGKIYWANTGGNRISVANLDGTGNGSNLDTTGATVNAPLGVAIDPDSNRIYWANANGDSISVANLDGTGNGSNLDTTGATVDTPAGIAIDPGANKVYWASFAPSGSGAISSANLDGTGNGSDLDTTGATVKGANFPAIYAVAGPGAPIINDSDPDSPANDNGPEIKGSAPAGSTVDLYTTSDCSGSPVATGTAADFASPGFTVSVGDDSSTTFRATATDGGLTSDCSSSGFTYVEDSTAPDTSVDSGPSGLTNDPAPSFGFSADEASSTFECRFDSDPFAACSGPGDSHAPAADLPDGAHTFEVRATDAAGNLDATPAARSFTVDATAPTLQLDSGPQGPTNEASPTFGFTAEAGASVECSIDTGSASFGPCSGASAHSSAAPLADGAHTFRVRATDAAGNRTTRTRDFGVDTQAPATTIEGGPQGPTNDASPSFGFSSEPGASFECRLDSDAWGPCSSPKSYSNLAQGSHTFRVRATDAAGNVEASPPQRGFAVEAPAPPPPPEDTMVDGLAAAKKTQRQKGKRIVIKIDVTAGEALTAKASGKIKAGRKTYRLKPKEAQLGGDQRKSLKLKPKSKREARKIAKVLKQGKKVKAKLKSALRDGVGNSTSSRHKVKLKG